MAEGRQRVLIVNAGNIGVMSEERQEKKVAEVVDALRTRADFIIVDSWTAAREYANDGVPHIDVILFRSMAMDGIANEFQQRHPNLRIVVMSNLGPYGVQTSGVIRVNKLSRDIVAEILGT